MITKITTLDGALGYTNSDSPFCVIGPATQGSISQVQSFGDPGQLYPVYGAGKLPDRAAFHFSVGGGGPVTCLRMASDTAGSIPAYQATITAAVLASASNTFPGPFVLTVPRNVEAVFQASWDGGNVVITGLDATGATLAETITAAAGSTVKGAKVFTSITGVTKTIVGATANTVTLKSGNKTAFAVGSDAQLVLSGSPVDDQDAVIRFTRPGNISGPAYPAYMTSFDGGNTFGPETAVPNGGSLALGQGLTGALTGAAVQIGDAFEQSVIGPAATTGDLTAALAVLSTLNVDGGELHILGALTGAQCASVISWRGTEKAAGRDWVIYVETRDYNAGESDASWQASVLADYAGLTDTDGCVVRCDGYYPTVLAGGRGIQRRSGGWSGVSQVQRLPFFVMPSSVQDGGGAVQGLYLPSTPTVPNYHDERVSPGMGGTAGRGFTFQSLPGVDNRGKLFIGDVSLRDAGTLAGGTSDWSLLPNARLGNRVRRAVATFSVQILQGRYATKADGTLTTASRLKLNDQATEYLIRILGGAVVDTRVEFSGTEPVKTSRKVPSTVYLDNWSYILEFDAAVGLLPVTRVAV